MKASSFHLEIEDGQWKCWAQQDYMGNPPFLAYAAALTPIGSLQRCIQQLQQNEANPRHYAWAFKKLRQRRRVTTKDAAATLGITQAALNRAEKPETALSPEQYKLWAEHLGWLEADLMLSVRDAAFLDQSR